jgi:hypothetical protein
MSPPKKGRKSTVKKIAKGKPSQIQTLAKAVKTLQLKDKVQHQYLNYGQAEDRVNVIKDYLALNMCNFSVAAPIFGTDADDDNNYKIVHQSFIMDCYLSLENVINEPDTTTFTMFLVSLRDDIGTAFNTSTGGLTLTDTVHYYNQSGQVLLNKKCFKIHKAMRRVLTNHGTALANPSAQSQYGTDCRFTIKASPRQVITNVRGDWKVLPCAQDPSKQYYFLIFSDNSAVDLQSPAFTYNIVRTMKTIV